MKEEQIHVSLMVQPYSTLTYALPQLYAKLFGRELSSLIGTRVLVPLGRRKEHVLGILSTIIPAQQEKFTIKPAMWFLDKKPLFSSIYVAMVQELAKRYAVQEGVIYAGSIPAPLRSISTKIRFYGENATTLCLSDIPHLPKEVQEEYLHLWHKGEYVFIHDDEREYDVYTLLQDPPWNIKSTAHKQRKILHTLWEEGSLSKADLKEKAGITAYATLEQLITAGFIDVEKTSDIQEDSCIQYATGSGIGTMPPCTQEQYAIVLLLKERTTQAGSVELLFGITGSGKSRIYCELIQHVLSQGKNVILLAPEVALVQKLAMDIDMFFKDVPYCIYHGYQSPLYKKRIYEAISHIQKPSIIIGTRSALFVPIRNIGLIILDEEHDSAYKQENGSFLYNAKDIAWIIAQKSGAMLLLGSATPDIKTLHAGENGKIHKHILEKRATGIPLPSIEFVDMKEEKGAVFSKRAIEALQKTIEQGEQAIILLNRRGYAPHIFCTACTNVQQCPHCLVSMVYHKSMNTLRCSYCGYSEHFPKPCASCGAMEYITLGSGTEKLQEELQDLVHSDEEIIRLDRDIARSPKRIESILSSFIKHKASILVGTQMLAKGHNFPNVSLSVIVDADSGLHFPDYRAMERVFQLVVQTSGRAGRNKKQGHVIIQTLNKENPCWQYVINNDYMGLYHHEIEIRKKRVYPPFTNIAIIRFICTLPQKEAKEQMNILTHYMREEAKKGDVIILGPVPSPIAVLRGQYRYQILLKASSWQNIRSIYKGIQHFCNAHKEIRVVLDIDPVSMM